MATINQYTNINLCGNELQNAVIQNLSEEPLDAKEGQVYFNTTFNLFKCFQNGIWETIINQSDLDNFLPETPENPEYKYLNGNKQWKEIVLGSGGYATNIYFTNQNSDISTYKKICYINDIEEMEILRTISNEELLFTTYLCDQQLDINIIDAGVWTSSYRVKLSSSSGITQLKFEAFVRHDNDSETTLFSTYSDELINIDYLTINQNSNQPSFNINTTDRLGIRIYGKTTHSSNITISTIIGGQNASYFNTPIALRHKQLRGLNEDIDVQHLDSEQLYSLKDSILNLDTLINLNEYPTKLLKTGRLAYILEDDNYYQYDSSTWNIYNGVNATLLKKGIVKLSNSYEGIDETVATTEKALKDGLDLKQDIINIESLTEKITPIGDDILLIEDSTNSFSKKKIKIDNLPFTDGEVIPLIRKPSITSAKSTVITASSFETIYNISQTYVQFKIYNDIELIDEILDSGDLEAESSYDITELVPFGTFYAIVRQKTIVYNIEYTSEWSNIQEIIKSDLTAWGDLDETFAAISLVNYTIRDGSNFFTIPSEITKIRKIRLATNKTAGTTFDLIIKIFSLNTVMRESQRYTIVSIGSGLNTYTLSTPFAVNAGEVVGLYCSGGYGGNTSGQGGTRVLYYNSTPGNQSTVGSLYTFDANIVFYGD